MKNKIEFWFTLIAGIFALTGVFIPIITVGNSLKLMAVILVATVVMIEVVSSITELKK